MQIAKTSAYRRLNRVLRLRGRYLKWWSNTDDVHDMGMFQRHPLIGSDYRQGTGDGRTRVVPRRSQRKEKLYEPRIRCTRSGLRHNSPLIDFTTSVILTVKIVETGTRGGYRWHPGASHAWRPFSAKWIHPRNVRVPWSSGTIWSIACSRALFFVRLMYCW